MITTKEYGKFMKDVMRSIKNDSHSLVYKLADTSLDELKLESIEKGINKGGIDGAKATYSRTKLSSSTRARNILNGAGAYAVKFIKLQSWGNFRLVQGLKSRFVNLKYTGEHWESFQLISMKNKVHVVYYGDMDLISELSQRYGEYYRMTDKMLQKGRNEIEIGFYNSLMKRL